MAKLYFKYGAMGSSKTAQALITKYNYEENGLQVWLMKPSADTRDGVTVLRSRIGLEAQVDVMTPDMDIYDLFVRTKKGVCNVIIVDECQFLTPRQIDELRAIVNDFNGFVFRTYNDLNFTFVTSRERVFPHHIQFL